MKYLAHTDGEPVREQTVKDHLQGTADKAAAFADAFGARDQGYYCGLLHDIGKYSDKFQRRIRGENIQVDHSTAGASTAFKNGNIPAALCICGHHSGLPYLGNMKFDTPDDSTLAGRVKRAAQGRIEDYSAYSQDVSLPPFSIPDKFLHDFKVMMFYIRMLYSCLVDADYLDTEEFMQPELTGRGDFKPLPDYRDKLAEHIKPWLASPSGELNVRRTEILSALISAGSRAPGYFTLTAPTGSGKTVASMAFALEHAVRNGLRRVIYVIPYCSIIEQTQHVFEQIFGEGSVVAHYSDVEYNTDGGESGDQKDKRYLASENWDAPVIVTTNVQFFESLYADRSSHCRKLHNIAGSVIIFDEAQMLPTPYLRPCVYAISQLVRNYGCSAVLCTATQPSLNKLFLQADPGYSAVELCPRPAEMYEFFRRVNYVRLGKLSNDDLVSRLTGSEQVLCIVNRRDMAQDVYRLLPDEGRYHLSTAMYPDDRRRILDEIRQRLKDGKVCRVVSTSLVEAGVDVDFPTVYRELAGLDSIIQAGGRCNREGRMALADSTVYIFESEKGAPKMLQQNIAAAKAALDKFADASSPQAVKAYFDELYYIMKGEDSLDSHSILAMCDKGNMPFPEVSEEFNIIDNLQFNVIIPCEKNRDLISQLLSQGNKASRALMRKLGKFTVGVYKQQYDALSPALQVISENTAILTDPSRYKAETGIDLGAAESQALFS